MEEDKCGLDVEESEKLVKHNWGRRHQIIYKIRLSIFYHLRRERFLHLTDKNISAFTLASATAAVVIILDSNECLKLFVTAFTAVLSLLPLVFDFAGKARSHQQLTYEFRKLLAECISKGEYWTEEDCDKYARKFTEVTMQEGQQLSVLVVDCQNRMAKAEGGIILSIPWPMRLFMHFIDFNTTDFVEAPKKESKNENK